MLGSDVPHAMPNDTTPTTVDRPLGERTCRGPPLSPWQASLRASGSNAHNCVSCSPLRKLLWSLSALYSSTVTLHVSLDIDVTFVLSSTSERTESVNQIYQRNRGISTFYTLNGKYAYSLRWWPPNRSHTAFVSPQHRPVRSASKRDVHNHWTPPDWPGAGERCRLFSDLNYVADGVSLPEKINA